MLHTCENCDQFIRESTCPFCATVQKNSVVNPLKARLGVSRGALLVGGALAIAACGDSTTPDADLGIADAGSDATTAADLGADLGVDAASPVDLGIDLSIAPAYGVTPDAGELPDLGEPDLSIAPLYGIAPADAGEVQDAGEPDLSIAPLYGIPPSEPGDA
jgi:hypothetical protein